MKQTVTISFEKPFDSVKLLDDESRPTGQASADAELLESQKQGIMRTCQALQDAAKKVNEFQEKVLSEQKEQIAKLAVEIAGKILRQETAEGNYRIQTIIKEALESSPTPAEQVVVHLNPDDLAEVQKTLQSMPDSALENLKFVGDANVGRAECTLETPKGVIESLIEAQLERIGEALAKAE